MKAYINQNIGIYDNTKIEGYVELITPKIKVSIVSSKWLEITEKIDSNTDGREQIAKAFEKKPAKIVQWFIKDNEVIFELYHSNQDEGWDFQEEFLLSKTQLEKFIPIFEYCVNIKNEILKEISTEADAPVLKRNK
jgi:hypothetical protein